MEYLCIQFDKYLSLCMHAAMHFDQKYCCCHSFHAHSINYIANKIPAGDIGHNKYVTILLMLTFYDQCNY